jgi:hypothetical protein
MGIYVKIRGGMGAKVRLGIYANNDSADNYPKARVLDAGEIDVGPASNTGPRFITNLNTQLTADNRYWAAILGNDGTIQIGGLPKSLMFFWGANAVEGVGQTVKSFTAVHMAQNYGPLPDPAPVTGNLADLTPQSPMAAIVLGFSAVT